MTQAAQDRFPPQVRYIIGNEGCERFSFYGMKNILVVFLVGYMKLDQATAKADYHLFVSAVYFFPLIGGYLADRFWGKYNTIYWLSLFYCAGHGCLALFDDSRQGFYFGLFLIALGAGGIKPCVASFVGDQFNESNKHLAKKIFAIFYWMVNFGSFFASLLIPDVLRRLGPKVAFGIPGVLMAIATLVFWLGRTRYVHVPPTGGNPHGFLRVLASRLFPARFGPLESHPASAVEGMRAVLSILVVFAPIPMFWALFDQKGSTWVLQAKQMDLNLFGYSVAPAQLMALNPLLVMLLIPFLTEVFYPLRERLGRPVTLVGRMRAGMFIAALAFVAVGVLQYLIDGGRTLSVAWQAVPYLIITLAEVLVSTTGLEFAYSQAPLEMKGTIMSLWNLTVTVGNLITATISALNVFTGAKQFLFFAALTAVAGVLFTILSRHYRATDRYQT